MLEINRSTGKGSFYKEAALYSRLYLLQGIVAFHQQQYPQAQQYLERAASTIARLKVDDEAMTQGSPDA
ncbi:hypothetical protein IscW_ISCW005082 [Ixodes scapularis]|uniref:Uncharacterized protein n=1 Tax=Ixodes scapularis TaxID=6945 RepID=B7PK55_IXOSC|nr:hypothetical protein IscW_ISCW005082 [Ixodes scapularis]|eukprot:XP_002409375.1 hypothetical protein IscW_ISCW005082 [Ixodes scapularis]